MPGLEDAPKLTVKAFAELLRLPAYEQLRILEEHKYPRQAPQSYRTPYLRARTACYPRVLRERERAGCADDRAGRPGRDQTR